MTPETDQKKWIPRLIWVFDVCKGHVVGFVMLQLTSQQNQQNDCVPSEDSDQPGHAQADLESSLGAHAILLVLSWGGSYVIFRKLLLELREDITDKEFNTLQFYLDGKVKKKKLQDKKNMMELFIFLEREGLISHDDPKPLITLMKTIKRADLVDLVKDHYGKIWSDSMI